MRHQTFVFRCINGFGNKLCNLVNMFYVHAAIPEAEILLDWVVNEHCRLDIADIIDLSPYPWIKRAAGRRPPPGEFWACTSVEPTRWDSLEEWKRHRSLVSISFHLYRFVPLEFARYIVAGIQAHRTATGEFCRSTVAAFRFHPAILERVAARGPGRPVVHIRGGDLQRLLEESGDPTLGVRLRETIATLDPALSVTTYSVATLEREPDQIRDSVADLLWLSRVATLRGYCPYSHFSSWAFLLSAQWDSARPIFDYRKTHLELLT